ncbi:MAG: bifunctional glutamate N-acetyltransferase/amino-acid acetyltransferase ArgJ [Anaerolineaceae bacterium]|nr:bifunctional glutamate N-acetyltransferase/amino-acid acetyltransferase ArgJ [Anaerolineaceae bacterium]
MTEVLPYIDSVPGFQVAGTAAGLRPDGKADFALIYSESDCVCAGVFTRNVMKAAPVLHGMARLEQSNEGIRAIAINTRSANACTGRRGLGDAEQTAAWVADALPVTADAVLVMSTGVIGLPLPMEGIRKGIEATHKQLGQDWEMAARAIMTTDTWPKLASVQVTTAGGARYTLAGISKGSGMIAPDMATMLAVIVTDAALTAAQAIRSLERANELSFNRIVVDGDMSTNDTAYLLANGHSGVALESATDLEQFQTALDALTRKLAQDIVRDGEGATKFVTIQVRGSQNAAEAKRAANSIARSPLFKTALFGEDANWGRAVAAAGYSGAELQPEHTQLFVAAGESLPKDPLHLFENGMPTDYAEADAAAIMAADSLVFLLDCGCGGPGEATVWTCDFSHDYVSINGDYRS